MLKYSDKCIFNILEKFRSDQIDIEKNDFKNMIKNGWKEKQKLVLWKGMTEETDWGQGVWVVVQQQESIVLCSG